MTALDACELVDTKLVFSVIGTRDIMPQFTLPPTDWPVKFAFGCRFDSKL